jgi:hypothetical protein
MTIDSAKARVDGAKHAIQQLKMKLVIAESELKAAEEDLRIAKIQADDHLPRATMVTRSRRSGNISREPVAVVRRTAKQVTVRRPGSDTAVTFRLDRGGRWKRYPRPTATFSDGPDVTLEIDV